MRMCTPLTVTAHTVHANARRIIHVHPSHYECELLHGVCVCVCVCVLKI
jgi:hypothetical protein